MSQNLYVEKHVRSGSGVDVVLSDGQSVHLCHTDQVPDVVDALVKLGPYMGEGHEVANALFWKRHFDYLDTAE